MDQTLTRIHWGFLAYGMEESETAHGETQVENTR